MDSDDDTIYDLSNGEVVDKYKAAGDITNRALNHVVSLIQPGARIVDLCAAGDNAILEAVKGIYVKQKGLEKGIAFPTCISANECAGHNSPLLSESGVIAEGDLLKIDMGTHIDGMCAVVAHTVVCTSNPAVPVTGRQSDAICAAYYAAEAALRLCRPGNKNTQVTSVINQIANTFQCNLVEGVLSHQLKRFVLEGDKVIAGKLAEEQTVEEFTFEENEVYSIDILMSTGEGKVKERDTRTTVFKREVNAIYNLKMKTSRTVYNEINSRFPSLPFSLRALEDEKRSRMGIVECVKHELVRPFPVLFERPGEFVAQFKFTVLLLPGSIQKITSGATIPFVQSQFKIEDPKINAILATGLKRSSKKKKKKPAAATATTTSSSSAAMDTE